MNKRTATVSQHGCIDNQIGSFLSFASCKNSARNVVHSERLAVRFTTDSMDSLDWGGCDEENILQGLSGTDSAKVDNALNCLI